MCSPGLVTSRHRPILGIVEKIAVFAKTPPQTKLLASIVALIDQVAFVGVGTVTFGEGFAGSVPGLRLEAVVVFEAQVDTFTQGAEECGLVGGSPAKSRALAMGGRVVTSGAGAGLAGALDGFRRAVVVFRHGADDRSIGGCGGMGSIQERGRSVCAGSGRRGAGRRDVAQVGEEGADYGLVVVLKIDYLIESTLGLDAVSGSSSGGSGSRSRPR